jgi:SepF-like predicted cell division protein (DUF552 family)
MVTVIENLLGKGSSPSQIEHELHQLCQILPGSLSQICDNVISSGQVHLIITELTNGTAPHLVCSQVKMCPTQTQSPPRVGVKGEEECKMCELLTTLIEEYLAKGMSASEIIAELKKICSKLPGGLAGICDGFVESGVVTKIIGELTNGTAPHEVCTQLHLCASLAREMDQKMKGEEECKVCELFTSLIEQYLAKGMSASQIIAELKSLCGKLPGALAGICDNLVESGVVTKIIGELTNGTSPEKVCTQLHLCTSMMTTKMPPPKNMNVDFNVKVKGEEECKVCELLTTLIEEFLSKGMSASEIIAELKKVCSKLPGALAGICDNLVESGMVTKIIGELTNGTAPHEVCTQLHLCAALREKLTPQEVECAVCKMAVSFAEYYISTSNLTASQIEKKLEEVCNYFGKEKALCVATIMVEAPKIINELKAGTPAAKVCETIKMCASSQYERTILRKEPTRPIEPPHF